MEVPRRPTNAPRKGLYNGIAPYRVRVRISVRGAVGYVHLHPWKYP